MALDVGTAKALTIGLSKLNSMAFGLAVYASQAGLPRRHARLASGRWSGTTGRAFHPQDSTERFQSCFLHLIPLSQASWRNPTRRKHSDLRLLVESSWRCRCASVSVHPTGLRLAKSLDRLIHLKAGMNERGNCFSNVRLQSRPNRKDGLKFWRKALVPCLCCRTFNVEK